MSDLLTETLRLAKGTKLSVKEICKAAGVKPRWYYRFLDGDFEDPGVRKVERLHTVLSEAESGRSLRPAKRTAQAASA